VFRCGLGVVSDWFLFLIICFIYCFFGLLKVFNFSLALWVFFTTLYPFIFETNH